MKIKMYYMTALLCSSLSLNAYEPIRYRRTLEQIEAMLRAKEKRNAPKLSSSTLRLEQAHQQLHTNPSPELTTIIDGIKIVIEDLNAAQADIVQRLKIVQEQKAKLPVIKDKTDETKYVQRAQFENIIADLRLELSQIRRNLQYIEKQRSASSGAEQANLETLVQNRKKDVQRLTDRIRNEERKLQSLK